MTKDEYGIPNGQLLSKLEDCGKDNGTLIKVPLKGGDEYNFIEEATKQLAYLPNVYIENINYSGWQSKDLVNSFNQSKIIEGKGWRVKDDVKPIQELHISLENITYSIDWTEIGMSAIQVPFALTFNTGELKPTPSRESVEYNKESIKVIKERVDDFVMSWVKKYNKENEFTDDYSYWKKHKNSSNKQIEVYTDNITNMSIKIDMRQLLINYSSYNFNDLNTVIYKPFYDLGLKNANILSDLFFDYKVDRSVHKYSGKSKPEKYTSVHRQIETYGNKITLVKSGVQSNHIKNYYILDNICSNDFYFVRRKKKTLENYKQELRLSNFSKDKWRNIIQGYQKIVEDILAEHSIGEYDSIHINPNWLKDYKAGKSQFSSSTSKRKDKGEIHVKYLKYGSWIKDDINLNVIEDFKGIVIYDVHENKNKIFNVSKLLKGYDNIKSKTDNLFKFYTVSKTNCKKLKEMSHTYTPDEFLKSDYKVIKKVITAYKLRNEINKYYHFKSFLKINEKIYNIYQSLQSYINSSMSTGWDVSLDSSFIKELLKLGEELNLYDKDKLDEFQKLKDYQKGAELISIIDYNQVTSKKDDLLIKYLKQNKKRVNKEYYLKNKLQLLDELINKQYDESNKRELSGQIS